MGPFTLFILEGTSSTGMDTTFDNGRNIISLTNVRVSLWYWQSIHWRINHGDDDRMPEVEVQLDSPSIHGPAKSISSSSSCRGLPRFEITVYDSYRE
jgi:hypothetical protein